MLHEEVKKYRELSGDTNPNTPISRIGGYLDGYEKALEQEPVKDIKEYYKDIWDCDINHPRYEDTVAEIVEISYRSGYVHGVENTAKEFRFELEQKTKTGRWITINNSFFLRYKCSECERESESKKYNYCPNCGAKMQEVKK